MNFLAPLMLFGLLAIAIPPILHLLNRKEAKPQVFPAMEFLRRAYRKTARRLKMKQWLLLALRMLLFAFLALALSKPMWSPQVNPLLSGSDHLGELEGTQVILFDQSYAMDYLLDEKEGRRLFDLARSHALRVLAESSGPAAVITFGAETKSLSQSLTADHQLLSSGLKELKVSQSYGQLDEALSLAYQLLRDRPKVEAKQITLLSTPNRSFDSASSPPPELGKVRLSQVDLTTRVDLGSQKLDSALDLPKISLQARKKLANHAITRLTLSSAPQRGEDQWRAEVEIANYSPEPMNLWPIWVELEGEVLVRGFVTLAPYESGMKRLYFKAKVDLSSQQETDQTKITSMQAKKGWIKLANDPLPIDDQWPFWIEAKKPTKLLALNGDPRPTPHEDELFYLERALAPQVLGGAQKVQIQSRLMLGADLKDEQLEGVDIILLANVPRPSLTLARQIKSHLEAGGGLWLAPGARTEIDTWNRALGDFLPRPLRGMRRAGDAASVQSRGVARLNEFDIDHSLLRPFEAPQRSSLALAEIEKYILFDPKPTPQSAVIIKLNEGSPFLMTRQVAQGRVVMFAGPLDREWNDLVIRPDFVPLASETVRFLSRDINGGQLSTQLGSSLKLELNGDGPFFSLSPQGEREGLSRVSNQQTKLNQRDRGWLVSSAKRLGHHQILGQTDLETTNTEQSEHILRRFVVSLDHRGSRLSKVAVKQSKQENTEQDQVSETMLLEEQKELWHLALFGLFILTCLEGVVLFQKRETSKQTA